MKNLLEIMQKGWIVDEMRWDHWQKFIYMGAKHDSGEVSVEVAFDARVYLNEAGYATDVAIYGAVDELVKKANASTPQWYLDGLKNRGN